MPQVGPVGPDRLVLGPLGHVLAVFVDVDPRALDRAAAVAGVGDLAAPLDDHVVLPFAADRLGALELPLAEVLAWDRRRPR